MNILITGGAGFIGTNLIANLKEDHTISSIDNYSTGKKENHHEGVEYVEGDIIDIKNNFNPEFDIVFHLAAIARIQPSFERPEDYINTNFQGTYNIVKYCIRKNIPLIYAGSSSHHSGKFKNIRSRKRFLRKDLIVCTS